MRNHFGCGRILLINHCLKKKKKKKNMSAVIFQLVILSTYLSRYFVYSNKYKLRKLLFSQNPQYLLTYIHIASR